MIFFFLKIAEGDQCWKRLGTALWNRILDHNPEIKNKTGDVGNQEAERYSLDYAVKIHLDPRTPKYSKLGV